MQETLSSYWKVTHWTIKKHQNLLHLHQRLFLSSLPEKGMKMLPNMKTRPFIVLLFLFILIQLFRKSSLKRIVFPGTFQCLM